MATGTGKTYTAFQIIYRLWKAGKKKRILFLTDRNALIDQTKRKDFRPFGSKMTVIRNRTIDKAYEIYLSLYHQLVDYDETKPDPYKEFSPDFFDLIVIDECHRGSAKEDNQWRKILNYFSSATHIGMTATPKETKYVSNIEYFGKPVFTYSLRQGIEDGFLAPYKVIRVGINVDLEGWRPENGKTDVNGEQIEDRIYNVKDFEKNLVIDERTKLVAKRVSEFLKRTDRYDKTIIFCVDIEHAERMRQALTNENADITAEHSKYVMRITGDEKEGKRELDNFTNPEETYPVIATTSKLMTTGIDAETCKLIVIERNINSMTEFKQIIGRGTRINEEYGKTFFTIMDCRKATDLFAEPNFDGDPVMVKEVPEDEEMPEDISENTPEEEPEEDDPFESEGYDDPQEEPNDGPEILNDRREKIYVRGVDVSILNERIQYIGKDGKLITESLKDYTRRNLRNTYQSLDDFLNEWKEADRKEAILEELEEQGIILEDLRKDVSKDLDVFDLICHVAWDKKPLTRKERAENVKKRDYFTKYGEQARKVLEKLLDKYASYGIETIEDMDVLRVKPFDEFGTPIEIIEIFGGKENYLKAVHELENEIYKSIA
jgi:type I restriction enzyme R subunit